MQRKNKKESVAALHEKNILCAAEKLFSEKGFDGTTIDDVSKASGYSRRTIYCYFTDKKELLLRSLTEGLKQLKEEFYAAIGMEKNFSARFRRICFAQQKYYSSHTCYAEMLARANPQAGKEERVAQVSAAKKELFLLGEEINGALDKILLDGQAEGKVRDGLPPLCSILIGAQFSALFSLINSKGEYLAAASGTTKKEFLECGFDLIYRSVATSDAQEEFYATKC